MKAETHEAMVRIGLGSNSHSIFSTLHLKA